jgi:uncharacterized protein
MPIETAKKYIKLIFSCSCAEIIEIVFHGGEPLLHKTSWYEEIIDYINSSALKYEKKIKYSMQSNCTKLDIHKFELIAKNKIVVGTSMDGPPNINDKTRGRTEDTLRAIKKLKQIRCFGGIICVINKKNYNKMGRVFEFFEKQGIHSLSTHIYFSMGKALQLIRLKSSEILKAYVDIYEYMKKTKGNKVVDARMSFRLSLFLKPRTIKDFKDYLICFHPYCGAAITTIMCDTSGNLFPCGCFNGIEDYLLGNITAELNNDYLLKAKKLHNKQSVFLQDCVNCKAARICEFGCPAFNHIDKKTMPNLCEANRGFFDYLCSKDKNEIENILSNINK